MTLEAAVAQNLRLRACLPNWESISSDSVLLRVIRKGVQLKLKKKPKPRKARTMASQPEKLQEAIDQMAAKAVIRPLTTKETLATRFWTSVFDCPKRDSDKVRVITDLRPLNDLLGVPKFRQETWTTLLEVLESPEAQWAVRLDLVDFYHHLALHPNSARWARFRDPSGRAYQCTGLPFGLSASPYWTHRLTKPVVAAMRQAGLRLFWYVDDILLCGPSAETVTEQLALLVTNLTKLGFKINAKKSTFVP
eukprot:TRINITY_DN3850_c0_g1_i11.p2 TRINITY_DN3850_c0_g1~~TRINITY_DN3850_c0_g1_i11.p2  ORF type:complete len:250 (+),score=47.67 TRINITY_DN3850_c0_g1_i11:112-861(+)